MKARTMYGLWFGGGILVGGLLAVGVPLAVLASGVIDMSAARPPGEMETVLASWALDRSMANHAQKRDNPFEDAPSILSSGMRLYQANCVLCHGAPEVAPAELAHGLNPPAPSLYSHDTLSLSDGQLFWVIRNGIRMTGMPAFGPTYDDEEIWHIVAFVRHLPDLTESQRQSLQIVAKEEGDHHGATDHTH